MFEDTKGINRTCTSKDRQKDNITEFVNRLTWRVPLLEQELLILPEHLSSPPLVLCVCFVDSCLYFWPLCCLFFYDLRILITPLISSNSSSYNILYRKIKNTKTVKQRHHGACTPRLSWSLLVKIQQRPRSLFLAYDIWLEPTVAAHSYELSHSKLPSVLLNSLNLFQLSCTTSYIIFNLFKAVGIW
jgi:hypothetical protein